MPALLSFRGPSIELYMASFRPIHQRPHALVLCPRCQVLRLANVLMNDKVALDDDACLLVLRAHAARKGGKQALHFFL